MSKVFLSHSSKDKEHFVAEVAKRLKRNNVIYDEYSFEEGGKTLTEIINGLDVSDLFVFFISDNSLNSEWVKIEVSDLKQRLDDGKIKKFYPVIIDNSINYTDSRIPDWMKNEYNIQPIMRPSVVVERIRDKLIEIDYNRYPKNKELSSLFVGRNGEMEIFEERVDSYDKKMPTSIIISGLNHIGRRTFMFNALKKANIIQSQIMPESILMDSSASIEDFILKLNDFGITDGIDVRDLIDKSMYEKIDIIKKFSSEFQRFKKVIFIVDDGSIVRPNRSLAKWFYDSMVSIETSYPIFCIASRYQCTHRINENTNLFWMNIRELSIKERSRLFKKLLDIYAISINERDFNDIVNNLYGYPEQIKYAVQLINTPECQLKGVSHIIPKITEFNTNKVHILLQKYDKDDEMIKFLRLLAQFELVKKDYLIRITENINKDLDSMLENLYYENIIDILGLDYQLIILSDVVRDYIKRNRLEVDTIYLENIKKTVQEDMISEAYEEMESNRLMFTIKEFLKSENLNNISYIIPSHYIKCMQDIYFNKGDLGRVIELADIVLQKSNNISDEAIRDIRYYLCLSLAKKKDTRLLQEVQYIDGDEHKFLLGFYYRHCGRYSDALEKFREINSLGHIQKRVSREIVQVLVQIGNYDEAFKMAKENHEANPNNQFHLQSYINCMINSENCFEYTEEIESKIKTLSKIDSTQAKEMGETARALFLLKIKDDRITAFNIIEDCISMNPDNYYPILAKADMSVIIRDKPKLNDAIELLSSSKFRDRCSERTLAKYKSFAYALNGDYTKAIKTFENYLNNYTPEAKVRFENFIKTLSVNSDK